MTQTVQSARTGANPYATFKCFCLTIRTKEHAQLIGVLSFAVFICLTVIAVVDYWPMALIYIGVGIFIYAYLMDTLFRTPRKYSVLAYLVFETLQIGFYIAFIIFLIAVLIFGKGYYYYDDYDYPIGDCSSIATSPITPPIDTSNTTIAVPQTTTAAPTESSTGTIPTVSQGSRQDYERDSSRPTTQGPDGCYYYVLDTAFVVELLIFILFLTLIKAYFATVFSRYYRYMAFAMHRANMLSTQYVNGRGVQIQMDDHIFPAPPLYTNAVIQAPGYSYSLHQDNNSSEIPQLPTYTELPSYTEVTSIEKQSLPPESSQDENTSIDNNTPT